MVRHGWTMFSRGDVSEFISGFVWPHSWILLIDVSSLLGLVSTRRPTAYLSILVAKPLYFGFSNISCLRPFDSVGFSYSAAEQLG